MRKMVISYFRADGIVFRLMVLDASFGGASQMIDGLMGLGYFCGASPCLHSG